MTIEEFLSVQIVNCDTFSEKTDEEKLEFLKQAMQEFHHRLTLNDVTFV